MGNSPSTISLESFLIERIISSDILIGIKTGGKQGMKWRGEIHDLVSCQEFEDRLVYQFEKQHFLEFSKGFSGELCYTLTGPSEKQIGCVPSLVRSSYKAIEMNSGELDKLLRFMRI